MRMRVVTLHTGSTCLDLADLAPRVQRIIALVVRDADLLCSVDNGSVEYHFTRTPQRESVKPKITLHPPST